MGRPERLEPHQPRELVRPDRLFTAERNGSKARPATSVREFPAPSPGQALGALDHPGPPQGCSSLAWRITSRCSRFWALNKPAMLVALSQLFGACMNLCAGLLELEGEGMHPIQVLLVRQGLTAICCLLYIWWRNEPDLVFGEPGTRRLLLARSMAGFLGNFCMWYSMLYLALADATVITFLAPGAAGLLCCLVLHEPFTRMEQLSSVVALLGVVLIAKPAAFFSPAAAPGQSGSGGKLSDASHDGAAARGRLLGVCIALLGVVGVAGAFTTIRVLGRRVHPVTSINALAMGCAVVSATVLALAPALNVGQPSLRWISPASARQWLLMLAVAVLGFAMQYLLTLGLAADTSNRANAMVYTHMLFAAAFDRWVLGHRMGMESFLGCALILGSAVAVIAWVPRSQPPSFFEAVDVEQQGEGGLAGVAGHFPMATAMRAASPGEQRHDLGGGYPNSGPRRAEQP